MGAANAAATRHPLPGPSSKRRPSRMPDSTTLDAPHQFAAKITRPRRRCHSALAGHCRVPTVVLLLEIVGAAVALGLLALYLAILSRGVITVVLAAVFVSMLLLITFDLDRPTRGFVRVPDAPLVALRATMSLPPAAQAPNTP
jgi:hypothetical protein